MIEIKTENKSETVGVTSSMEGRAIDLMAEGVAIAESLIDDFYKHGIGTEFLFMLASMVGKKMVEHDNDGGENLA